MKRPALYFLLFSLAVTFAVCEAKAQGTQDAVTLGEPILGSPLYFSPYLQIFGASGGVGWTFTPTENLLVTAIVSAYAPQISFWQNQNQILASFAFTNSTYSLQPITPLFLSAGQNYSISAQNPNFASTIDFIDVPQGDYTSSSYLNGIASYSLSSSGQWTAFPFPSDILIGPNFQFQVVPEPGAISMTILGFIFCVRKYKFSN